VAQFVVYRCKISYNDLPPEDDPDESPEVDVVNGVNKCHY